MTRMTNSIENTIAKMTSNLPISHYRLENKAGGESGDYIGKGPERQAGGGSGGSAGASPVKLSVPHGRKSPADLRYDWLRLTASSGTEMQLFSIARGNTSDQ